MKDLDNLHPTEKYYLQHRIQILKDVDHYVAEGNYWDFEGSEQYKECIKKYDNHIWQTIMVISSTKHLLRSMIWEELARNNNPGLK